MIDLNSFYPILVLWSSGGVGGLQKDLNWIANRQTVLHKWSLSIALLWSLLEAGLTRHEDWNYDEEYWKSLLTVSKCYRTMCQLSEVNQNWVWQYEIWRIGDWSKVSASNKSPLDVLDTKEGKNRKFFTYSTVKQLIAPAFVCCVCQRSVTSPTIEARSSEDKWWKYLLKRHSSPACDLRRSLPERSKWVMSLKVIL